MSFRFIVHQSERLEIRCFPGPTNMSSLVSFGRLVDRGWHSANILLGAQINRIERAREIRKLPSRWYLTIDRAGLCEAEMTVGELTLRGYYLGSNVTYNVKKLVEQGYLAQHRSVHDRRSVHIRLTKKGQSLRDGLVGVHKRHVSMLPDACLQTAEVTLRGLQRFWSRTGMILAQRSPLAA